MSAARSRQLRTISPGAHNHPTIDSHHLEQYVKATTWRLPTELAPDERSRERERANRGERKSDRLQQICAAAVAPQRALERNCKCRSQARPLGRAGQPISIVITPTLQKLPQLAHRSALLLELCCRRWWRKSALGQLVMRPAG